MKKRILPLLVLSLLTSACTTLKSPFSEQVKTAQLNDYSTYISAAIADWIIEEAKEKQIENVKLQSIQSSNSMTEIEKRLAENNINVTIDESIPSLQFSYSYSEIGDKILIKIQTNEYEIARLFRKTEGNAIIPASPLNMRANP